MHNVSFKISAMNLIRESATPPANTLAHVGLVSATDANAALNSPLLVITLVFACRLCNRLQSAFQPGPTVSVLRLKAAYEQITLFASSFILQKIVQVTRDLYLAGSRQLGESCCFSVPESSVEEQAWNRLTVACRSCHNVPLVPQAGFLCRI